MSNLFDYLDWRGDLSFSASPFNEVDNLILSILTSFDFENIVPPPNEGGVLRLQDAAEAYFRNQAPPRLGALMSENYPKLLHRCASCERFRSMELSGYVAQSDEVSEEQFATLTFHLPNDTLYVGFRGTDDTLIGWKEDFNLAFLDAIPSQLSALHHVQRVAEQYPTHTLYLGGHSKGGNLAMYSAVHCDPALQQRILRIYNNDGPGLSLSVDAGEHDEILSRVHTIVPQSSVVGMLLRHSDSYHVVYSTNLGLFQHDGFSWQVMGTAFVREDTVDRHSRIADQSLRELLRGLDRSQREAFVDALYEVLTSNGVKTLTELRSGGVKNALHMAKVASTLDASTHEVLFTALRYLLVGSAKGLLEELQQGENFPFRKHLS